MPNYEPFTFFRSNYRDIGFDLRNLGKDLSGITPLSVVTTSPSSAPPPGFYIPCYSVGGTYNVPWQSSSMPPPPVPTTPIFNGVLLLVGYNKNNNKFKV